MSFCYGNNVWFNFQEVLQRHPLHTIAQLIQYSDGFNRQNIAVKIGQVGKNVYQCYLFQCNNEVSKIAKLLLDVYIIIKKDYKSYQSLQALPTLLLDEKWFY